MRYASFTIDNRAGWGAVAGNAIADLSMFAPDLKSAIASGRLTEAAAHAAAAPRLDAAGVEWLPVIPNPDKIICVGVNYVKHRDETGRSQADYPTIFARYANSQTGHRSPMVLPSVSTKLDFEGELAVIIGAAGRHIAAGEAFAHVAGYSCYNDGSVRDFQSHTQQFTPGKNFPATGGFGPAMVTPDEIGPIGPQVLRTRLNGTVMQEAPLSDMIFDIPALIAYCSGFTRIEPGDVIISGTPGGVGARRTPPVWLQPGDVVEVEIDGIGVLLNTVEAER